MGFRERERKIKDMREEVVIVNFKPAMKKMAVVEAPREETDDDRSSLSLQIKDTDETVTVTKELQQENVEKASKEASSEAGSSVEGRNENLQESRIRKRKASETE